jgi:hypothetical protein
LNFRGIYLRPGLRGQGDQKGRFIFDMGLRMYPSLVPGLVIDTGVLGHPAFLPQISRDQVASVGGSSLSELSSRQDRGEAMDVMGRGAAEILKGLHAEGKIDGVIGMGGGGGTSVATTAMRVPPIGFPVDGSTAALATERICRTSDITMMPSRSMHQSHQPTDIHQRGVDLWTAAGEVERGKMSSSRQPCSAIPPRVNHAKVGGSGGLRWSSRDGARAHDGP